MPEHATRAAVEEGIGYEIEWIEGPLWHITEEDLREQAERTEGAINRFFEQVSDAKTLEDASKADAENEEISPEEAAAQADSARMDLLNERIARRIEKEGADDFDRSNACRHPSTGLRNEARNRTPGSSLPLPSRNR